MILVQNLKCAFCSQYCSCSWASSHCGNHYDCVFIFTRFWCTPTHVRSKPWSDFALLRHRLPKLVNKSCAHIWRGSYSILERLV